MKGLEQIAKEEEKKPIQTLPKKTPVRKPSLPNRKNVENKLKAMIKGQDDFIKKLLTAIYRHIKFDDLTSRILVVGSTGSGKTETIKQIAKLLKLPYTIEDSTMYTQQGYVGMDVENILQNLVSNAINTHRFESLPYGIAVIDEIDKKASSEGFSNGTDISGKAVQQSLLKMMDGVNYSYYANIPNEYFEKLAEKGYISKFDELDYEKDDEDEDEDDDVDELEKTLEKSVLYGVLDTSKVIFICMGAFEGLQDIRKKRLGEKTIGFSELTDNKKKITEYTEKDFLEYGMIREFIGRFDTIAETSNLSKADLINIMKYSELSPFKTYAKILQKNHIELLYSENLFNNASQKAFALNTGARAIRTIVNYMFEHIICQIMDEKKYHFSTCILYDDIVYNNKLYNLK